MVTLSTTANIGHALRRWRLALAAGRPRDHALAVIAVTASVALCILLEYWLPVSVASFSLIFLSAVLVVAVRTALAPALTTAILGFLAYNYFFTEPRYTFEITRPDELVAVALFLVMGLAGGNLANRLRRQVGALKATNEQSRKLLQLNRRLAEAGDLMAIHRTAANTVARFTHVPVCTFEWREGSLVLAAASDPRELPDDAALRDMTHCHERARGVDDGLESGHGNHWHYLALCSAEANHGVLALRLDRLDHSPTHEELQLFEAYASQVAQALTRTRLTTSLEEARIAEETERLRSALLSSVSHDLRTPLASMIGAASSLRELDAGLTEKDKRELLDALLSEGHRLDRYIENLLDMTRLGHGAFRLQRDWAAPADLIAAAIRRTRDQFPTLKIERSVPADLPLLYVHSALVEQAIFNVLENAARFSPPGCPVRIEVAVHEDSLAIRIDDEGPGIPEAQRKHVFDMFFSGADGDGQRYGSGLGLAICRGMLAAHGGEVEALAGSAGRGTTIEMRMPLMAAPSSDASR